MKACPVNDFLRAQFLFGGLLLACSLAPTWLGGQRIVASTSQQIDLARGQLAPSNGPSQVIPHSNLKLEIANGELILEFYIDEAPLSDQNRLVIKLNGEELPLPPNRLLSETHGLQSNRTRPKRIIWTKILEDYGNLVGELEIILIQGVRNLLIDCGSPPSWTIRERNPYAFAAVAGAATIGVGQLLIKNQSSRRTLTNAGIAILFIDGAWYLLRLRSYKKQMMRYMKFCGSEPLSLHLFSDTLPLIPGNYLFSTNSMQLGLQIKYNF